MVRSAATALIVGIDIGTSATKVMLTTSDGQPVRDLSAPHETTHPQPGYSEQDPESAWWRPAAALIREIVAGVSERVASVCVTGLGPCVLVVDDADAPLRPAILYGVDTRSGPQIMHIRDELEPSDPRRARLTTQSVGPKLVWLQEEEPQLWARTRRIFTAHNYFAYRLGGDYVLDRVSASWWDPLIESDGSAWREDAVARWMPGIELPRIVEPDAVIGRVTSAAAAATGLPTGIDIHAGTTDYAAHIVGSGVRRPGDCLVVFGTTLSVNVVTEQMAPGRGAGASPAVAPGTWYAGGVTAAAGALLDWVGALLGADHETLTRRAETVPSGSEGVLVLPYFAGERSPVEDPELHGAVLGLDLAHTQAHVYRAALESIAFSLRHILDGLGPHRPDAIRASGGAVANELLMQTVADVVGLPVFVVPQRSGAAYGSCILAGAHSPGAETAARATYLPDAADALVLEASYGAYRAAADAIAPVSHRISRDLTARRGQPS